jgi:hypothetical protein
MTDPAAPGERRATPPAVRELKARGPMVVRVALAIAACVPAFISYLGATGDAETRAQVVKQQADRTETKAGAGYQVTREAIEDLKEQVAQLRAELGALKRAVRAGSKTVIKAAPPPPAAAVAPPLPPTLDQAVQAAKPATTGAPAEAPKP